MTDIFVLFPPQIEALHPQIVSIYRAAFSAPPYNKPESEIQDFADSMLGQVQREGYRFVGAFDHDSRQLNGFAYGYSNNAGVWWQTYVRPAMPDTLAAHWLQDAFQFVELVVDPRFQGQGLGGRLHDKLLQGVPYARALLSTLQAETAAHRLYHKRGWQVLLQDFFFPEIPRRYQIMGLELQPVSGGSKRWES